jgi:hypothetical protein
MPYATSLHHETERALRRFTIVITIDHGSLWRDFLPQAVSVGRLGF